MKQASIIFSLILLVVALAVAQQPLNTSLAIISPLNLKTESAPAAFKWGTMEHNFEAIKKGTPVSHTFTFVNVGEEDLLITSVKPSCGCTVADFTKTAIPAGETGYVKATYNAAKVGNFTKAVTVISNAEAANLVLKIKGEVVD